MDKYDTQSLVQSKALTLSRKQDRYADEGMPIIEFDTTTELYQTLALRFLEWVEHNPSGVVSIAPVVQFAPFFSAVSNLLNSSVPVRLLSPKARFAQGERTDVLTVRGAPSIHCPLVVSDFAMQNRIEPCGQHSGRTESGVSNPYERIDLSRLTFIQPFEVLDSEKSYAALTQKYMVGPWGLRPEQCHFIDASTTPESYTSLIINIGGIGLSILPLAIDGSIGFNKLSHTPTQTTITTMDYTAAAICAQDLGGIQQTQNKKLFSLGSSTFFANPSTTMIIVATGHNKAEALAALARQDMPNTVIYTTPPTTHLLPERFYDGLATKESKLQYAIKHLMNVAMQAYSEIFVPVRLRSLNAHFAQGERINGLDSVRGERNVVKSNPYEQHQKKFDPSLKNLSPEIYNQDPILSRYKQSELATIVQTHLENAIEQGLASITNKKFLHTSPHHDDIALGYLPLFDQLIGSGNINTIATMTSGANAVTDELLLSMIDNTQIPARGDSSTELRTKGPSGEEACPEQGRRVEPYERSHPSTGSGRAEPTFINDVRLAIKHNPELIFFLKSCLREWEDERLWQQIGIAKENIHHLRLGFYHGPKSPAGFSFEHDILPVYQLLEKTMPDIITVAKDPEDSGPETHTKVLAIIQQAVDLFLKNYPGHKLEIWGYRNVWNTFHPSEATMIIPVTSAQLEALKTNFVTFYQSQIVAQFPYAMRQGPFCDISVDTMIKNLEKVKTLLGHNHPLLAAKVMKDAAGVIFVSSKNQSTSAT